MSGYSAERAWPAEFISPAIDFYELVSSPEFIDALDLEPILRSSTKPRIELMPTRLKDYSLMSMRAAHIGSHPGPGWAANFYDPSSGVVQAKQHLDGRFYKLFLNAPAALSLCYKNSPQALVSFSIEDNSQLLINQIQGIRSFLKPTPISAEDIRGARGLAPFDYPALMVRIAEEAARLAELPVVAIKSGLMVTNDLDNRIQLERAQQIYDTTAKRLGYDISDDHLWRKIIS